MMNKEDIVDNSKNIDVVDYNPFKYNFLNKTDKWIIKEYNQKFREEDKDKKHI